MFNVLGFVSLLVEKQDRLDIIRKSPASDH